MSEDLSDAEIDIILERFDQTEPTLQRKIVAAIFVKAERLERERDGANDNLKRMVSGFRSHLGDLIRRIGPARRPEDIKAALEDIRNAYNSWGDKSAEAQRDAMLAMLERLACRENHLCSMCGWHTSEDDGHWSGCDLAALIDDVKR